MKLLLLLVISCLALHNGKGAPPRARYMFVACNPEGGQANCVTQQTPEMPWTPDLPAKLPATAAQHLEAEPVEDEHPEGDEEEEEEMENEKTSMINDEGESPGMFFYEEGSGVYEGSAAEDIYPADQVSLANESETGSGATYMDVDSNMKQRARRSLAAEAKPEEKDLKEEHLLQL